MKILFLSSWYPFPPSNGSELRIYHLLAGLAERHRVMLLALHDQNRQPSAGPDFQLKMRTMPGNAYQSGSLRALLGLLHPTPRSFLDTHVAEFEARLREELEVGDYDLVIASQLGMTVYSHLFKGVPALLEEVELGVYRSKRAQAGSSLSRFRHRLTWLKLGQYLRRTVPRFSASTVVSAQEKRHLETMLRTPHRIEIIPNGVRLGAHPNKGTSHGKPPTIIFTGPMTYFANHDAMRWFLMEIFPHIRAEVPSVRLLITGNSGAAEFPTCEGVELTDYVEDVRGLVANADVSVLPLRLGGGTRLKVLEAMGLGTPVVSTHKGAEGLDVVPGSDLLLADEPARFAREVVRLLQEHGLRDGLARSARRTVVEKYEWSEILPGFLDLVEQLGRGS